MKYYFFFIAACLLACGQAAQSETCESQTSRADSDVPNVTVAQFEKLRLAAGTGVVVIDVRTPEEIAEGKVPEALEIDYEAKDFGKQIDALDKEKSYVVYCAAGGRSTKAAKLMRQKGFTNVYNLEGGYDAWEKEVSN